MNQNMEKLKDIVKFLDNYLKIDEIEDRSWNVLQIEGKPNVNKIVFAENTSLDIFKKAKKIEADLIMVHHGQFWNGKNPSLVGWSKERVSFLYENGISLYACHLPLDRHKEVGNNAQLIKLLGAKIKKEFLMEGGKNIGWIGEFKKPVSVRKIEKKINTELDIECKSLLFGKDKIKTIAVCSGGGGHSVFHEAFNRKVDLYLTGESIDVYPTTKDAKFNVIFAGHYATETLGVKALMKIVDKKFKVKTIFIDDPTGL